MDAAVEPPAKRLRPDEAHLAQLTAAHLAQVAAQQQGSAPSLLDTSQVAALTAPAAVLPAAAASSPGLSPETLAAAIAAAAAAQPPQVAPDPTATALAAALAATTAPGLGTGLAGGLAGALTVPGLGSAPAPSAPALAAPALGASALGATALGASLGTSAFGTSALGASALGAPSLGGLGASVLGASALGASALGSPGLGAPGLGTSALGASALGSSALGSSALSSSLLGSSALGGSALGTALGASALGTSALGNTALSAALGASALGGALGTSAGTSAFGGALGASALGGTTALGGGAALGASALSALAAPALASAATTGEEPVATTDTLSIVIALLAAAGGNAASMPGLAQALSAMQTAGAAAVAGGAEVATEEDSVRIPNTCVGWLKGRQGGMIRDIETRSGATIEIDQTTKDMGFSTVSIKGGTLEQKKTAKGLVIAEVTKVMDQSGTTFDEPFPGGKEEFHVDSQYVGWLKGPKGKVIQDLQVKSGTRIEIDQSNPGLGYATVKIFGTFEGAQQARALIAHELSKIGPTAAAQIASPLLAAASGTTTSSLAQLGGLSEYLAGAVVAAAAGAEGADAGSGDMTEEEAVCVPSPYVGWLKGRQGGMIRDIESRSGAQIDIDQSTKELGYSVARLRGTPEQKKTGRGLIIGEIAKVMDQSGDSLEGTFLGSKEEFRIDGQYIGWLKGPKGKVVQDLQIRSATRIEVDQSDRASGYALVKVFGTLEGIQQAKALIAAELSKVSPEAAAQVALPIAAWGSTTSSDTTAAPEAAEPDPAALRAALIAMAQQNNMTIPGLTDGASTPTYLGSATATAAAAVAAAGGASGVESQEVEHVRIPNSCVGWLKGRQGAMIREIETRSGAHVEIDQSTKEEGFSQANVRGSAEQRKTARGLVIAEIAKVMDQSGEKLDDCFEGRKIEIKIDSQYVGWLKGPKGKVVQDLQVRSGTRIDVDQSKPELGTATVKIFGDEQGTQQARALIAAELNKVSPEVAAQIGGNMPAPPASTPAGAAHEAARHAAVVAALPTVTPAHAAALAAAAAAPSVAGLSSVASALPGAIPGWPQNVSASVPALTAASLPGYNYLAQLAAAANPQALLLPSAQAQ